MSRLLIEAGPHESRVALLEEGRVAEVQIEDPDRRGVVGNLYKGRVSKVLPGIEAAFVDIGLERDAFLYAGDVHVPDPIEDELEEAAVDLARPEPIDQLLSEGDEILVQVVKDALANKGARITAQISLPGRFVVLLPGASGIGVSRRLDDEVERGRLTEILTAARPPRAGLIARTAAAGRGSEELRRDIDRLVETWSEIDSAAKSVTAPRLVHRELDLPLRFVRDQALVDLEAIVVDGPEVFAQLREYLAALDPELTQRVTAAEAAGALFDEAGVDEAIQRALRRRVWLPSGGYIVISPTEALVAIDVNTGRYTASADIETTALKVNSEAAVEVARQIRLRDLAGIIVVDFIDMQQVQNREQVLVFFVSELERDRTKIQVSGMSQLGLVELTRKRSHTDLSRRLTDRCPCCQGRGRVRSARTVVLALVRSLRRFKESQPDRPFHVLCHPRIAAALDGELCAIRDEIEQVVGAPLELRHDAEMRPDEYEIVAA